MEEMIDNSLVYATVRAKTADKSLIESEAPTIVNSSVRTREYLTAAEVELLQAAARKFSRWAHRDATMILLGRCMGSGSASAVATGAESLDNSC
jgi:dienelactone hydrolase